MHKRKVGVCCVVFLVLCGVLIEAGYSQSYSHLAPQSRLPREEDVKEPEARKTGEVIVVTYEFLHNPTAQDTLQERRLRFYLLASHLVEDWSAGIAEEGRRLSALEAETRAALAALAPDIPLAAMEQALSARDAAAMKPLLAEMSKTLPLYMSYGFMAHADEKLEDFLKIMQDHQVNPPEEMSLEDKSRIEKLIEYHFVTHEEKENPGLGRFVLDYFHGAHVIYEPRGRSAYTATINPFLRKYQIWIHGRIKESVDESMKDIRQSEGLSEDEAKRLAALFHTKFIVHEVIGHARLEQFAWKVEGEYFEILMEAIFIRGLSQNDFKLLQKFTHYVDEYNKGEYIDGNLVKKPLKMGEGKLGRVLPMWRNLDPLLFKEVLTRTERGIEWFERTMLPLYCPNEEYVYPDRRKSRISHVIQERIDEEKRTGKWLPILSRNILRDIDQFIGFQDLARRSISAIDMEGRRITALQRFEYSLKYGKQDLVFPYAVYAFKNDPFYRAMAVKTDEDSVKRGPLDEIEIVVDLSLIADIKRTLKGKYKIMPQLGQIIDMMVMREVLCARCHRLEPDDPVAGPRDKVRFHILTGDVPPEEAEAMLEEYGLRKKFCTLANDPSSLLGKIKEFVLSERYYDKAFVENEEILRLTTCFALNYENIKGAALDVSAKPIALWDVDSFYQSFHQPAMPAIIVASPSQPMGYVMGLAYLSRLSFRFPHDYVDAINQWLALTLPVDKARVLNLTWDSQLRISLAARTAKMETGEIVNRALQEHLMTSASL